MRLQNQVSEKMHAFIVEINELIETWHDQPLMADLGIDSTLARLRGLAADMVRLISSADDRGWDIRDIAYEAVNGPDGEAEEDHVDRLLSTPANDLDRQFDRALCVNQETGDVARPMYDGVQYVGGRSGTSIAITLNPEQLEAGAR